MTRPAFDELAAIAAEKKPAPLRRVISQVAHKSASGMDLSTGDLTLECGHVAFGTLHYEISRGQLAGRVRCNECKKQKARPDRNPVGISAANEQRSEADSGAEGCTGGGA